MKTVRVTKVFEITTSPEVMQRFENFLAMLQFGSSAGHSGTFGMWLDGDGAEKFDTSPRPPHRAIREANLIAGVGYDVEIARTNGFTGIFKDRQIESRSGKWSVEDKTLFKNGEVVKTTE